MGFGEHSATLLWKHDAATGTVDAVGFACNHGQCGGNYYCEEVAADGQVLSCPFGLVDGSGDMALKCSTLYYYHDGLTYQNDHYGKAEPEDVAYHTGACLTPYSWNSGDGYHNCHDDSRVQVRNVADPGWTTTGYDSWCDESGSLWNAPDCVDSYNADGLTTVCGDGTCGGSEDCAACEADCGACPVCGNGVCETGESASSCEADCGACSGCPSLDYATSGTSSATYTDPDTVKFVVNLTAGVPYTFSTCALSSGDTYLRLHKDGSEVASNDDGCSSGYASEFTYTPSVSGEFEIGAGCYSSNACDGTVAVSPEPNCGPACGNGVVEAGEDCDGGDCCASDCTYSISGTVCRAAQDACDAAETCSGTSASCPADGSLPDGTACTGGSCSGGTCVADPVCGNGVVEAGEDCDGGGCCDNCQFATSATVCRAAADECDAAETCTGTSASCPADASEPDGTTCSTGTCQQGVCSSSTQVWCTGLQELGVSLLLDEEAYYSLAVPAGATDVEVYTTGGWGDVDLYVAKDHAVSTGAYDCAPYEWGNEELCSMYGSGTYDILLVGYEASGGIELVGRYWMP